MISKLYENVVNYIKKEYKFIILCLVILIVGLFPLPINLYIGGGIINLDDRIDIENEYKEKGSFNLSYVRESHATIPTYLLSFLFDWERVNIESIKVDENDSSSDMWKREKLYLKEDNDNAIINAYRLAGEDITINKEVLHILYVDERANTNLQIGDEIISIDGSIITSLEDMNNLTKNKNIGDKVIVNVKRDGKEKDCIATIIDLDGEKKIGIYMLKLYDYKVERDINLKFSNREGGSSGGFMLSLAIYNRLVEEDITKGLKIVGTGTIDDNGNVGEIGGVKYKLKGAVNKKADIFFVPIDNYVEVMQEARKHHYDIDIVKVQTLKEAIEYLESR